MKIQRSTSYHYQCSTATAGSAVESVDFVLLVDVASTQPHRRASCSIDVDQICPAKKMEIEKRYLLILIPS